MGKPQKHPEGSRPANISGKVYPQHAARASVPSLAKTLRAPFPPSMAGSSGNVVYTRPTGTLRPSAPLVGSMSQASSAPLGQAPVSQDAQAATSSNTTRADKKERVGSYLLGTHVKVALCDRPKLCERGIVNREALEDDGGAQNYIKPLRYSEHFLDLVRKSGDYNQNRDFLGLYKNDGSPVPSLTSISRLSGRVLATRSGPKLEGFNGVHFELIGIDKSVQILEPPRMKGPLTEDQSLLLLEYKRELLSHLNLLLPTLFSHCTLPILAPKQTSANLGAVSQICATLSHNHAQRMIVSDQGGAHGASLPHASIADIPGEGAEPTPGDRDPQEEASLAPNPGVISKRITELKTKVQKECAKFHDSCQIHRTGIWSEVQHSEDDDRDTLVKDFRSLEGMRGTQTLLNYEIEDFHARVLGHPNIGACLVGKKEDELHVYIHDLPEDSPYAGGIFNFKLTFPAHQEKYEMTEILAFPPEVVSKTSIYHPNVGPWDDERDGFLVFLDLKGWRPQKDGIMGILEMIVDEMIHPKMEASLSPAVADHFQRDPQGWKKTARDCTAMYAMVGVLEPEPDKEDQENERLTKLMIEKQKRAQDQAILLPRETAQEKKDRKAREKEELALERERQKIEKAERKIREINEAKEARLRLREQMKQEKLRQKEEAKQEQKRQKLGSVRGGKKGPGSRGGRGRGRGDRGQGAQSQGNSSDMEIDEAEDSTMEDAPIGAKASDTDVEMTIE